MQYYEIKITSPSEEVENVSNALIIAGFETFEVDDTEVARQFLSTRKTYEWDYFDGSLLEEHDACITIYMDQDAGSEEKIARIREAVKNAVSLSAPGNKIDMGIRLADDSEWKDEWKKYFQPAHITDDIVICPSWEEYRPVHGEKVIEIDPGMAFGTGTHATTRMCIQFIEKYLRPGQSFMDVGCGSGILSVAAGLCGCQDIVGFDIDPDAVRVAEENVSANGMADRIRIFQGDVTEGVEQTADVIAANLMAEIIISICGSIPACLNKGGVFISSGIIVEKRDAVAAALQKAGFEIIEIKEEDDWCAIAARVIEV